MEFTNLIQILPHHVESAISPHLSHQGTERDIAAHKCRPYNGTTLSIMEQCFSCKITAVVVYDPSEVFVVIVKISHSSLSKVEFDYVTVNEPEVALDTLAIEFTMPPDFGIFQLVRKVLVKRHGSIFNGTADRKDDGVSEIRLLADRLGVNPHDIQAVENGLPEGSQRTLIQDGCCHHAEFGEK
jgi:hypothetical protein